MPKKMLRLIASKPMIYDTRRLQAGDEFEAPHGVAQSLVKRKRAEHAQRIPGALSAPPPGLAKRIRQPAPAAEDSQPAAAPTAPPSHAPGRGRNRRAGAAAPAADAAAAAAADVPLVRTNPDPQDAPENAQDDTVGANKRNAPDDDLIALRRRYQDRVGKRAHYGWDLDTLRQKLTELDAEDEQKLTDKAAEAAQTAAEETAQAAPQEDAWGDTEARQEEAEDKAWNRAEQLGEERVEDEDAAS